MIMREETVLLLEGKRAGARSLRAPLEKEGLQVHLVHTGAAAVAWATGNRPDIVVFDASSMRSSGVRSCRRIRRAIGDTPIIHCLAADRIEDRTAEADIYLVMPFTSRKLINRIRALLPADDLKEEIVRAGNLTFFLLKRSVDVAGRGESRLTPKLARLLEEFLRHPNEILGRHHLIETVWNTNYFEDTRTLDVHIRWLREIIEVDPAKPKLVKTLRGMGYIFNVPSKGK